MQKNTLHKRHEVELLTQRREYVLRNTNCTPAAKQACSCLQTTQLHTTNHKISMKSSSIHMQLQTNPKHTKRKRACMPNLRNKHEDNGAPATNMQTTRAGTRAGASKNVQEMYTMQPLRLTTEKRHRNDSSKCDRQH